MKILIALLLSLALISCNVHYVRTAPVVVEEIVVIHAAPPVYPHPHPKPRPPKPIKPEPEKPKADKQSDNNKKRPDNTARVQRPQRPESEQSNISKPQSAESETQRPTRTKPGNSGRLH